MSSKTISLKAKTYEQLDRAKGPDESFSDVIDRLLDVDGDSHPLTDLAGIADEDELALLRARSTAFCEEIDGRLGHDV